MKTFLFKIYIRSSGLELNVGQIKIQAKNYDQAVKVFNSKDIPFHHFSTVDCLKIESEVNNA